MEFNNSGSTVQNQLWGNQLQFPSRLFLNNIINMDNVGSIGSRRRAAGNHYSAEEQALDQIAKEVGVLHTHKF